MNERGDGRLLTRAPRTRPRPRLLVEPDGDVVRVLDQNNQLHLFSSRLIQDGSPGLVPWAGDQDAVDSLSRITPWGSGGGIRHVEATAAYFGSLRKRFSGLFERTQWEIVLSPFFLSTQAVVWQSVLREAGIRDFQLQSNLSLLSHAEKGSRAGLFLRWGRDGFDLGCCLQGVVFRYQRFEGGEREAVDSFLDLLDHHVGIMPERAQARALLSLLVARGVEDSSEEPVPVGCQGAASVEELWHLAASSLSIQQSQIESFIRSLTPRDHADLFHTGLCLSGPGETVRILAILLDQTLEIPVRYRCDAH